MKPGLFQSLLWLIAWAAALIAVWAVIVWVIVQALEWGTR